MKNKFFYVFSFILLFSNTYCYDILESWLATPGSFEVYLTHEVDSLKTSWGLNFPDCIIRANAHTVTNVPTLVAAQTTSENNNCIVKYDTVRDENGHVDYKSIATCSRIDYGSYISFTITVNDSVRNTTFGSGGNVNINSVMLHELTHSFGLNDITDPTALMHLDYTGIMNLTNDEINGIKNVYEKPKVEIFSKHQVFNGNMFAIFEDDSVEFILRGIDFLTHNSILPVRVLHDRYFLISDESSFNGFYGRLDTLAYNVYDLKASSSELKTDQIKKLRTYQRRDAFENILSRYKNENAPCSLLTFEVLPECFTKLNLDSTASSSKYYSFDDKYYFSATCTDSSGTSDYPNLQDIKFYYKKSTESSYTLISSKNPTEYKCNWNSGTYKGDVIVKAVASFLLESGSSVVLTDADSLTIKLLDGFECDITNPKPYKVEAVDFEKYLDIGGKLFHDGTVDVDTLETMYNISDMQHGGLSILSPNYIDSLRCPAYKYRWFSLQLPWPYGTPLKGSGTGVAYKLDSMEEANTAQEVSKEVVADSIMWCEPLRNDTLFIDEDWAYPTMPGLYRIEGRVYGNNTSYEIARRDTLVYMKPSWKLKLYGDYWFSYSAQWGKPYVEKTAYAIEQQIKMYVWRPFVDRTFESTNFTVSYEGLEIANFT